jgi:eukaryotic-like serine/threonine-protein kinase
MQTQTQRFLQGEIVDGKFQVGKYLGGSDHSAVFLTQYGELRPRDAAIKLVPARPGAMEAQLSRWRLAANFSHPHLAQILDMGRCEVGNTPMLYVVTELASENLSQIIPERALTPDEAREMLAHVLDVLTFIHSRGFVHGHVKPANILAIGDELKLSSDGICRLGETIENWPAGVYDPPEGSRNGASPAGDVWSIGMTLVEVLTQRLPDWTPSDRKDPVLPETLPAAFLDVAHHCLRREPKNRWGAAEAAAHLPRVTPAPVAPVPVERQAPGPRRFAIGATMFAVALTAIFAGSRLVGRHAAEQGPQEVVSNAPIQPEEKPSPAPPTMPEHAALRPQIVAPPGKEQASSELGQRRPVPASTPASQTVVPPTKEHVVQAPAQQRPIPTSPPAPAKRSSADVGSTPAPAPTTTKSASNAAPGSAAMAAPRGRVVHQVLPDVPKTASDTIWGTVRVGVRVSVDSSGKVTRAELDSAGPSRYFAALSLQAARNWEFAPPSRDGGPVASAWILHFNYTNSGTSVVPSQTQP